MAFPARETGPAWTTSARPVAVHAQGASVPELVECDRALSWNVGMVPALLLAHRPDVQHVAHGRGAVRAPLCCYGHLLGLAVPAFSGP